MIILKEHICRTNSHKTICATAALTSFGIPVSAFASTSTAKNLDAYEGVIRRNGFALRSRRSSFPKKATVGGIRGKLSNLGDPKGTVYLVRVKNHVLVLDRGGKTIVDTAPRKRDRRAVVKIHAVWSK